MVEFANYQRLFLDDHQQLMNRYDALARRCEELTRDNAQLQFALEQSEAAFVRIRELLREAVEYRTGLAYEYKLLDRIAAELARGDR